MSELTFISSKWLKPLPKKLASCKKKYSAGHVDRKARELGAIVDAFGAVFDLAGCYVEPFCQDHDPSDYSEGERPTFHLKAPVFPAIDSFLKGDSPHLIDSSRQMFVLSESGMGKTSLLTMIKLTHLAGFWPQEYDCLLLKLGEDTLDTAWRHPNKANTILLLDALDEDPLALGKIKDRLSKVLEATEDYYRVIISCRTQSLLSSVTESSTHPERIRIDDYTCLRIFLVPFDHEQVADYLAKRFPSHPCDILLHCSDALRQQGQRFANKMDSPAFSVLLLAHINDIMASGLRESDIYNLYRALFEAWLAREEIRLRKTRRKRLGSPPNSQDLRTLLITIAVFLQQRGESFLSRAALYQLEKESSSQTLDFDDLARLGTGERSLLHRNTVGDFRFAHYSIQEFLVAHGVLLGKADLIGDAARVTDLLSAFLKAANVTDLALPRQLNIPQSLMPIPDFHFHDRMQDGSQGPAMQPIPAGEFLMGSPEGEGNKNEHPQHRVRIPAPFALGTWPVTFQEYDHFCAATGRKKPQDQGWGRKRYPVNNVSWQDALDYCAWLSQETGHHYRLPSEAEWEYAARAGTRTRYWWGDRFHDESDTPRANCDTGNEADIGQTSLVGSFPRNAFGLYDTAGNIREWTADCWHDNYQNAPSDGRVWTENDLGDCEQRVVRGGSWNNSPQELRSASRDRYHASKATYSLLGLRLVREF
uniref:Formylglycine-generating enzyme, required for sulfatase activity, contains SUMF1/FGE domain n=1 Tax=Candidatus Kentrum sp. LPFa TaxID=2126335 RepID=A0A450W9M0_9GAMM|nr:MAG: Formylglycine-generating enzyme, required for sulfatase activity, contains SUMF1/FGE domain [Candidatus Kentron sp. LPFa]VFK31117.1 MAG: Formylglycine-generating enzyme, required for sulfatase activity, contains SUMF1/FGE domain [Candidatus Kentron sp. LPFa]